jgi:hypothetical protein
MNNFDIFIAFVEWDNSGKTRPILILERHESIVYTFNITTKYGNKSETIRSKYFKINDWKQAGLAQQSYVDTNIVRELSSAVLNSKSKIGKLTKSDVQKLINFLSK